jgi:hypothetical protein
VQEKVRKCCSAELKGLQEIDEDTLDEWMRLDLVQLCQWLGDEDQLEAREAKSDWVLMGDFPKTKTLSRNQH